MHLRPGAAVRALPGAEPGPDGVMRSAPQAFERKGDAERYSALVELAARSVRGRLTEPGKITQLVRSCRRLQGSAA
jgi:hypothetical protein